MARSRNIKPGLYKNELLGEEDPSLTILFTGLWCLADREGRLEDRPRRIKAEIFPYRDITASAMDALLDWLADNDFIIRYSVDGCDYIQVANWAKHQNPHHKEIASIIPSRPQHIDTVCKGYIPLSNTIRSKIYARDGRKCGYCGATEKLNIDHIQPVTRGGNSTEENLQVLCSSCNGLKGNNIVDNELSKIHGKVMLDSCMKQEQSNQNALSPTDSLNLIPDSLNLIPSPNNRDTCVSLAHVNVDFGFEEFYNGYPRKTGRKEAIKAWRKLKPSAELVTTLINDCKARVERGHWCTGPGKGYIPGPAPYLNQEKWTDEIIPRPEFKPHVDFSAIAREAEIL